MNQRQRTRARPARNRAPHLTLLRGGRAADFGGKAGQAPPSRPRVGPAALELAQLARDLEAELAEIVAETRVLLALLPRGRRLSEAPREAHRPGRLDRRRGLGTGLREI